MKGKGEHHNLVYILMVSLQCRGAVIPVVEQRAASLADGYRRPYAGFGVGADVHSGSLPARVGKLPAGDMEAGSYGPQV